MTGSEHNTAWWGEYALAIRETARWDIGPLTLWIQHLEHEWRVAYEEGQDTTTLQITVPCSHEDIRDRPTLQRFGVGSTSERIRLRPLLADRPIVTSSETPFQIPAGERVTVFVSTPVWVALEYGDDPSRTLVEIPSIHPSPTWFGPAAGDGHLCYTATVAWRLVLDELPERPHRARTAVRISNLGEDPLHLDQMSLPIRRLGLYVTPEHRLLTQDLALERRNASEFAEVRIEEGPPKTAPTAELLTPPRTSERSLVFRSFYRLWT